MGLFLHLGKEGNMQEMHLAKRWKGPWCFYPNKQKNPKQLWKETKENSPSIIFILGQEAIWKQIPAFWLKSNNITHWAHQNGKR